MHESDRLSLTTFVPPSRSCMGRAERHNNKTTEGRAEPDGTEAMSVIFMMVKTTHI